MEDYVKNARIFYERLTIDPSKEYMGLVDKLLSTPRAVFLKKLPGKRVLDLGCGPGRDSIYFKKIGLEPICADIAINALKHCNNNGLASVLTDGRDLAFSDSSFDGIWACGYLAHFPPEFVRKTLREIHRTLKPNGVFFTNVREGTRSNYLYDESVILPGPWLTEYSDNEFRELLNNYFEIINFSTSHHSDSMNRDLNYVGMKR